VFLPVAVATGIGAHLGSRLVGRIGSRPTAVAVFVTAATTALAMVEHREAGLASGVVNTFHEVGGSIGVAVVSTVAASGFERGSVGGFGDAFTVCAVTAVVGAVLSLGLVPRGKPRPTGGPHVH
jgi:sugar phosphate permease